MFHACSLMMFIHCKEIIGQLSGTWTHKTYLVDLSVAPLTCMKNVYPCCSLPPFSAVWTVLNLQLQLATSQLDYEPTLGNREDWARNVILQKLCGASVENSKKGAVCA